MFKNLRKAEGFTLIELIVVIAVLLLLMAIALPSFLGVRQKADKAKVNSNLTIAYHNAKAEWADNEEAYPSETALVAALTASEPGISFGTSGDTTAAYKVTVDVVSDDEIELTSYDNKGNEYTISANEATGVVDLP